MESECADGATRWMEALNGLSMLGLLGFLVATGGVVSIVWLILRPAQ